MVPAYDLLAPHYDAVTGNAASEAALVRDIIQRRHSRAVTLLDVACGTGAITALLAGQYQVSGLDISSGMLAVARAKLPGQTPLFLADMARFELNTRFDAIICAYQSVNHLLSFPAWESFFGCVYDHLDEDGVFVFDIATVGYLRVMANSPRIVQQFGDNYLVKVSELLTATELAPENYEKALSYLRAYKLVTTGSMSSGGAKAEGIALTHEGENLVRYHDRHPPA